MRRPLRRAWHVISWVGTLVIVVGWALFLRPQSLGGDATYVVIRGDSMEPAYKTGDLVIVRSAASYEIGDAVAYRVPDGETGAGTLVIHRITGSDAGTGLTLQGDNNSGEDPWHPRSADVVGAAYLHLPLIGRVSAFIHQPNILGGLAAAAVVMWVVARPPRRIPEPGRAIGISAQSPS